MGGQLSSFVAQSEERGGTELLVRKVKVKGKEAISGIDTIKTKLPSLILLEVNGCKLSKVPQEINSLVSLCTITLEDNKLSTLPSIVHLTHLKELNLASNRFTTFPAILSELAWLETLNLAKNGLTDFKGTEISRMTSLTSLNLSQNELASFPTSLCSIVGLVSVDLSENKLPSLPSEVRTLLAVY